ncbi:transcriptional regulator [Mycolicibacterium cyprinidarum]|uniref:Transcriptional regulator n=1 Tax=Mycolicibacterium cyprinidarum TaxID=2860311 RepID=A0ABQ4VFM0_9MYCO|nr:transcriptional regulator [Mycolicibacterium sp. NGTWS0302]GJF16460.1 transcriptional regulator [Mycolicibacterium sp. NGTWS1803]GJF18862.1 transcriptional regulator [Mycolicibacterium sp. NGTWSNA01]
MSKPQPLPPDQQRCETAPLLGEPLTAAAAEEIVHKLKALADPVRLRLFSAVASHSGGEACVCDVSQGLEVSQPTISHHLKVLREAGLLTAQRRGSWVYYAVVSEALHSLTDSLTGVRV